jgi:hypothetical protein
MDERRMEAAHLTQLEELLDEGQQLLAEIRRDCHNSRLAGTFTGGYGDCRLGVLDPGARVSDWTARASDALQRTHGPSDTPLADVPPAARKSLESESGYAARCLKARLAVLQAQCPPRAPVPAELRRWWRRARR